MATASTVHLSSSVQPVYPHTDATSASSTKASALLQENHEKFHIFFNESGFHNHVAHHLLSIWALNATPEDIQQAFDANKSYQRPPAQIHAAVIKDLHDPEKFLNHLGPGKHYNDFLEFFTSEIQEHGWQSVLQKYLFARDARAEAMFVRMHSGLLHPIIHLGFGVEFEQPAIIAEALAEAACHDAWIGDYLLRAEEKAAAEAADASSTTPPKPIVTLLDEVRADPQLFAAPHWDDANKIRDGILARAGDRMLHFAAQVRVPADMLLRRTAEMTNAVAYYTAGAQRRDKMVKFDFFFIHCLNCSIFYPAFWRQSWLREQDKVRLLEWKIRMDLAMYISRKSPEVLMDVIRGYEPKRPSGWGPVEERVCGLRDDGHASKLVRAMAHGQEICAPYEDADEFRLKRADWMQLGHMAIDSVESPGGTWVRSAGWDQAWQDVPAKL